MNTILQNILVLVVFGLAIGFLVKKFVRKPIASSNPKKNSSKSCGSSDCGCH